MTNGTLRTADFKVTAIILAAGKSTRMGKPKPLLSWLGMPLIRYQIKSLFEAGVDAVSVVTGHCADRVGEMVIHERATCVFNPAYTLGKSSSIKAGISSLLPGTKAVLLLGVDQPRPCSLIRLVINSHIENDALISCPRHDGHGGHPLVFDISLVGELLRVDEYTLGLRDIVKKHSANVNWIEVDSSIVRLDINTPKIYQEAVVKYPSIALFE